MSDLARSVWWELSALVLGILVLKEQVQWMEVAGMSLIFAGLAAIDGRLLSFLSSTSAAQ